MIAWLAWTDSEYFLNHENYHFQVEPWNRSSGQAQFLEINSKKTAFRSQFLFWMRCWENRSLTKCENLIFQLHVQISNFRQLLHVLFLEHFKNESFIMQFVSESLVFSSRNHILKSISWFELGIRITWLALITWLNLWLPESAKML